MKKVKYLNQDLGTILPPKPDHTPWSALVKSGLSKAKKIDLFYKLQAAHEAAEGNKKSTDTIERRLIAKMFSRKAQGIWMNCMLRMYDMRHMDMPPSEIDLRILDELFRNHGAMIKAGTI